jgi:hypothetical protein
VCVCVVVVACHLAFDNCKHSSNENRIRVVQSMPEGVDLVLYVCGQPRVLELQLKGNAVSVSDLEDVCILYTSVCYSW